MPTDWTMADREAHRQEMIEAADERAFEKREKRKMDEMTKDELRVKPATPLNQLRIADAVTAADRDGNRIKRGDYILYLGCKGETFSLKPNPVMVVGITKQGADGTILHCNLAPKPDYPHHFSCRASNTRLIA